MLWEVCLQDLFHISRNRREKEEGKTEAVAALLDHNTVKVMIKRNKEREGVESVTAGGVKIWRE